MREAVSGSEDERSWMGMSLWAWDYMSIAVINQNSELVAHELQFRLATLLDLEREGCL